MKIQKHLAYQYKDKKHYKHVIILPDKVMRELGWNAGEELEAGVNKGSLIIRPNKLVGMPEVVRRARQ